jgi:hypothetical protein
MNKFLLERLPEEYKVLWSTSKKKKIDPNLERFLQQFVKQARTRYKANLKTDKLQFKLDQFQNKGGWSKQKLQELARLIYDTSNKKAPPVEDLGRWLSVEIECIFQNKAAESEFVLYIRKNGWTRFVTIKDDQSIRPRDRDHNCEENYDEDGNLVECQNCNREAFGREIVFSFKFGEWEFVKGICGKLNELKCEVNKSCGLHVHFDCRNITSRKVSTIGKHVAMAVPALKLILPPSRANNRFCQQIINKSDSTDGNDRYAFVNVASYQRHQTLEIRGHSGTTDGNKIINWIKMLKTIMNTPHKNEVSTLEQLLTTYEFEDEVVEYIKKRHEKFSKPNNIRDDVAEDNGNNGFINVGL